MAAARSRRPSIAGVLRRLKANVAGGQAAGLPDSIFRALLADEVDVLPDGSLNLERVLEHAERPCKEGHHRNPCCVRDHADSLVDVRYHTVAVRNAGLVVA